MLPALTFNGRNSCLRYKTSLHPVMNLKWVKFNQVFTLRSHQVWALPVALPLGKWVWDSSASGNSRGTAWCECWNWNQLSFSVLNLFNMLNYFATSIYKCVTQVWISTGIFEIFAWVSISMLTQVHNSHLYLLKKKTNISKILTNLTNQNKKNLNVFLSSG